MGRSLITNTSFMDPIGVSFNFWRDHTIGVSTISIFGIFFWHNKSAIWYFICPNLFCFLIMAIERDDSLQSVSVKVGWKELFILELCDEKLSYRKKIIGICYWNLC